MDDILKKRKKMAAIYYYMAIIEKNTQNNKQKHKKRKFNFNFFRKKKKENNKEIKLETKVKPKRKINIWYILFIIAGVILAVREYNIHHRHNITQHKYNKHSAVKNKKRNNPAAKNNKKPETAQKNAVNSTNMTTQKNKIFFINECAELKQNYSFSVGLNNFYANANIFKIGSVIPLSNNFRAKAEKYVYINPQTVRIVFLLNKTFKCPVDINTIKNFMFKIGTMAVQITDTQSNTKKVVLAGQTAFLKTKLKYTQNNTAVFDTPKGILKIKGE